MKKVLAIAPYIAIITSVIVAIKGCVIDHPSYDINKGDVWEYSYQNDNPFEKPPVWRYYIEDIKSGYVLYRMVDDNGKRSDYTASTEVFWFKVGAKKINMETRP